MNQDAGIRFEAREREVFRPRANTLGAEHFFAGKERDPFSKSRVAPEEHEQNSSSRATDILDTVVTVSLFLIFFGFPIFFLGRSLQGIVFEKEVYFLTALTLGVGAWIGKAMLTGGVRFRRTPLDIPLLLFWGASLLSAVFSVNRSQSLWGTFGDPSRGMLSLTAIVLFFFLVVSEVDRRRLKMLLFASIASGTLVVLWTTLAFLGVSFLPQRALSFAPLSLFGTVRALLLFLSIMLPLFLLGFVLLSRLFQQKNAFFWFSFAFLGAGFLGSLFLLFSAFSFTPWLSLLSGIGFLLLFLLAKIVPMGKGFEGAAMALFATLLLFLMIGDPGGALRSPKMVLLPEMGLTFSASWDIAQQSLQEYFLVGSGPGTYGYLFSRFEPSALSTLSLGPLRLSQSGSFFLECVSTIGVVGAIAFLVFLGFLILVVVVGLLRSRSVASPSILSLLLASSLCIFLVALFRGSLDGSILLFGFLLVPLLVVALLEEGGLEDRRHRVSLQISPGLSLFAALLFLIFSAGIAFGIVSIGKAFVADLAAGKSIRLARSSSNIPDQSIALLARARALAPHEGHYSMNLAELSLAVVNKEVAKPESERNTGRIKELVERMVVPLAEESMRLLPNDVGIHERAGKVYENVSLLSGSDPEVLARTESIYRRALELEPKNPQLFVKLGLIRRVLASRPDRKNDREALLREAKGYFEEAVKRKENFAPALLSLALTEESLGEIDAAILTLDKATSDRFIPEIESHFVRMLRLRAKGDDLDRAERRIRAALKKNEKDANMLLNLGLLLEKKRDFSGAKETYLTLLPLFEGERFSETRKQIEMLIENVSNGTGNIGKREVSVPEANAGTPPSLETIAPLPTGPPAPTPDAAVEARPAP